MRDILLHLCLLALSSAFRYAPRMSIVDTSLQSSNIVKSMFDRMAKSDQQSGGAGGSPSYQGFLGLESTWSSIKNGVWKQPPARMVFQHEQKYETSEAAKQQEPSLQGSQQPGQGPMKTYDVVVCGGTLGIFYAAALQKKGFQVAVIERQKVAGRTQEWNISKKELKALISLGILQESDLQEIISIEFNPVRVGFQPPAASQDGKHRVSKQTAEGIELYVRDILNLGVKPDVLIAKTKALFEQLGGDVLEERLLQRVDIYEDRAILTSTSSTSSSTSSSSSSSTSSRSTSSASIASEQIASRLVIDCMGGASPIMRQLRAGQAPDGICLVVGACLRHPDHGHLHRNNTASDLLYANQVLIEKQQQPAMKAADSQLQAAVVEEVTAAPQQVQYFWEAFPAGSGPLDRTSYLFTYLDAHPARLTLAEMMADYWKLMPDYQGISLVGGEEKGMKILRILYGCFPAYKNSPLQSPYHRLLLVGDASGIQSPLSFGGFGSLVRHLPRLVASIDDLLTSNLLTKNYINLMNFYMPSLRAFWMFQKAMGVSANTADPSANKQLKSQKKQPKQSSPVVVLQTLIPSFLAMQWLGPKVMQPFLQDSMLFWPMVQTMLMTFYFAPLAIVDILPNLGVKTMLSFTFHLAVLGIYTLLSKVVSPVVTWISRWSWLKKSWQYRCKRLVDMWKYGSGLDYYDNHEKGK